jgi:hypothetical protein
VAMARQFGRDREKPTSEMDGSVIVLVRSVREPILVEKEACRAAVLVTIASRD